MQAACLVDIHCYSCLRYCRKSEIDAGTAVRRNLGPCKPIYFANNNHNLELIIQNKSCVGKTFPEFWSHIRNTYGQAVQGVEEASLYDLSRYITFLE